MSRKQQDKGRLGPFVPLLKETLASPAWRKTSHGARSLYVCLKMRYSSNLHNNGRLWVSQRDAAREIGSGSNQIARWFRELQHYGFIAQAVYGAPVVVGYSGAYKANEVRRDPQGREVFPLPLVGRDGSTARIAVVITGVPRAGRDDGYEPPAQPAPPYPMQRYEPAEPKSASPPPRPQPDATETKRIIATIAPRDERDCGIVFEGSYKVQFGQVHVYSADGKSLGSLPVGPDDDVESVARKLLRDKLGGNFSDFYGTIRYPKLSIH